MPRINPIQRCRAIGPSRGVSMTKPSSGADAAHTILTITEFGGLTLVTTEGPNGLSGSETIVISGNSVNDYNMETTIFQINSPTEFVAQLGWTEDGTGGQWELA